MVYKRFLSIIFLSACISISNSTYSMDLLDSVSSSSDSESSDTENSPRATKRTKKDDIIHAAEEIIPLDKSVATSFQHLLQAYQILVEKYSDVLDEQLHTTIRHGDHKNVKKLIADGVSIHRSKTGNHLTAAALHNQPKIAQILIKHKAPINAQNNEGQTALMMAAYCQHEEMVKLLLDAKADPAIQSKDGSTAKDSTTSEVIHALLQAAIDCNTNTVVVSTPKDQ